MTAIARPLASSRPTSGEAEERRPDRCIASGWVISRLMTNGGRAACPLPSCSLVVAAKPVPGSIQIRVIPAHDRPPASPTVAEVAPATREREGGSASHPLTTPNRTSCVADQVAEFFHERGLLPVISAARGPVAGRSVHAALPALPQVSLCAKATRMRPCTAAELVARPCRACLKINTHWLLTGRWLAQYVRRVRQHLDWFLGDRGPR